MNNEPIKLKGKVKLKSDWAKGILIFFIYCQRNAKPSFPGLGLLFKLVNTISIDGAKSQMNMEFL